MNRDCILRDVERSLPTRVMKVFPGSAGQPTGLASARQVRPQNLGVVWGGSHSSQSQLRTIEREQDPSIPRWCNRNNCAGS